MAEQQPRRPRDAFERGLMESFLRWHLDCWEEVGTPLRATLGEYDEGTATWGFGIELANTPFSLDTLFHGIITGRVWLAADSRGEPVVWWRVLKQPGVRFDQENTGAAPVINWEEF